MAQTYLAIAIDNVIDRCAPGSPKIAIKSWGGIRVVQKKTLSLKWLLLGSLITNTGISFIWPLTTIYMHEYLHESLTTAGIVLFADSLFMIIGNYLGGLLFDRWNRYYTTLCGISLATIATDFLIFFHGWPAYPLFLILSGLGNGIVATCINSFATVVAGRPASYVFNLLYFTNNLGLVLGTLIVGFILPYGITYIFVLAFSLFALFLIVAAIIYRVDPIKNPINRAKAATQVLNRRSQHQIFLLLFTLFVTWVAYEQWQSNIAAYMVAHQMTVKDYSLLWTFNAVLIVLLQPILTYFDQFLLKHLHGRMYLGFTLFASSFALLLIAKSYHLFILAMGVLTIGEILALPAVSTYVDQRVTLSQKGRYQGLVNVFASAGRAVGPLVGATIIESSSYQLVFLLCVCSILLATVFFALGNRTTGEKQTNNQ